MIDSILRLASTAVLWQQDTLQAAARAVCRRWGHRQGQVARIEALRPCRYCPRCGLLELFSEDGSTRIGVVSR